MVQHVFPKGCQRIRDYGVQATKTCGTLKGLMQEALARGKGIIKGALTSIALRPSRQHYRQSTGRALALSALYPASWGYGASGISGAATSRGE
jgi:hypothetical protein